MKHDRGRGLRGALLAAVAGTFACSGVAAAQTAGASTPGADLRRQLGELAANPTSVSELVETGRAAIAVGDGEAALGFFTRASELAPQDARVKAGLAAANTRTGRPETALLLFSEALAAGAPEAEIAAERGLAYDLLGQPARAQQDYLASLKLREDPEVRRRLALSLAISGQREAALRLLEPQVRLGDRAGSRARIMVMALSGDPSGATAAATASLPPGAAQAIAPFLTRLASLDPGQKAAAANLGRLPGGGVRSAGTGRGATTADPGALAFAGGGSVSTLASRLPVAPAAGGSTDPRRRPGAVNSAARSPARTSATTPARTLASASSPIAAIAGADRAAGNSLAAPGGGNAAGAAERAAANSVSAPQGLIQPHPFEPLRPLERSVAAALPASSAPAAAVTDEPVELAGASGGPRLPQAELQSEEPVLTGGASGNRVQTARAELPAALPPAPAAADVSAKPATIEPAPVAAREPQQPEAQPEVVDGAAANLAVWNSAAVPARAATPNSGSGQARLASQRPGFSDVVATVSALPVEGTERTSTQRAQPSSRAAPRNAAPSNANAAARTATPARTGAAAHPSRIWVQLAVSPNRAGFGYEIGRMRRAAPDLFKDRTPHVAPIGSSHRLLVGPFPNAAAARTFINGLKQKDIEALAWTSPAGTQVERFAAGR